MDLVEPIENLLEGQLRLAIGIDWTLLRVFRDRRRIAISENGAGGGENESIHAGRVRLLQQRDGVAEIIAEILSGILHRLADQGVSREVHDGLNRIFPKRFPQRFAIANIGLHKSGLGRNDVPVSLTEIVVNADFSALFDKPLGDNTADVTSTACYEYHGNNVSRIIRT
jgi:hypothetical protein